MVGDCEMREALPPGVNDAEKDVSGEHSAEKHVGGGEHDNEQQRVLETSSHGGESVASKFCYECVG